MRIAWLILKFYKIFYGDFILLRTDAYFRFIFSAGNWIFSLIKNNAC